MILATLILAAAILVLLAVFVLVVYQPALSAEKMVGIVDRTVKAHVPNLNRATRIEADNTRLEAELVEARGLLLVVALERHGDGVSVSLPNDGGTLKHPDATAEVTHDNGLSVKCLDREVAYYAPGEWSSYRTVPSQ